MLRILIPMAFCLIVQAIDAQWTGSSPDDLANYPNLRAPGDHREIKFQADKPITWSQDPTVGNSPVNAFVRGNTGGILSLYGVHQVKLVTNANQ